MLNVLKRSLNTVSQRRYFTDFRLGIVGVPLSKGTGKARSGVDQGPSALRKRGLLKELSHIGINVRDYGDLEFIEYDEDCMFGKTKFPLSVSAACQKISNAVKDVLSDNRRCLTIGGDHSVGIGTVYGHSQVFNDLCVLWVDAHVDINTEYTSMSGNIHGMPCSFLIKEMEKYKKPGSAFNWIKPCLSKKSIAYIGAHSIDPMEKLILREENILHFTMSDIDRLGIIEVVNRALDAINPTGQLSLHVSFDIDSVDKTVAASTTVPLYGGLTLREVLCLAEEISKRGAPKVVDVVEIDPTVGSEQQVDTTLGVALEIIKALLGNSRSGTIPKGLSAVPVE